MGDSAHTRTPAARGHRGWKDRDKGRGEGPWEEWGSALRGHRRGEDDLHREEQVNSKSPVCAAPSPAQVPGPQLGIWGGFCWVNGFGGRQGLY